MKNIFQILILFTSISIWAQKMELVIPTGFPYTNANYKLTPNGRFFIGADEERLILWEAKTHRQIRTFNISISKILDFKISPDSKNVVIFNSSNVESFDVESGKKLWTINVASYHYSGIFIENGNKIIIIGNDDGYIVSAKTGAIISTIKNFGTFGGNAYLLPSNKVLLVKTESYCIYDVATNTVEPDVKFDSFKKRKAVSEKNALLFVVSTGSSEIQCYDLKTNKIIKTITCDEREPIIGTTMEGDALLVRYLDPNDANFQISIVKKYSLPNFDSKTLKINDIRGDSDGSISGSSTYDMCFTEIGNIKKLSNGQAVGVMSGQLQAYGYGFFTNSNIWQKEQIMGFEFDNKFKYLDFKNGQIKGAVKLGEDESTLASTISANGKVWAAYFPDNTIRVYDVETGKMLKSFPISKTYENQISRQLFRFSPSGDVIYVHFTDGSFTEFNIKTGVFKPRFNTYASPYYTFSDDGRFVGALNGSSDLWKVGVWNMETGQKLMDLEHKNNGFHRSFNISNDGKLAVVLDENAEAVYDVQAKTLMNTKSFTGSYGFAKSFWNMDNTKLAVTGEGRGVRMVDKLFNELFETKNSGKGISNVIFTSEGSVFFTIEGDQINIFLTENGKLLGTYYSFKNSEDWLVVTPDGRYDGSQNAFKRLYYVKNTEIVALEALFEKFYTPGLYSMLINGTPPSAIEDKDNIDNLKSAPKVKIQYDAQTRNLAVEDDMPSYTNTNGNAKLTVNAECPEDGVAEIRLFHNGKLVGGSARNLVVETDMTAEKSKTLTFDVSLVEGQNLFKAIALNAQRTESQPDEIMVNFTLSKPSSGTSIKPNGIQLHLLVIGINTYKNPKYNLNYAAADATSFKEAIEKGGTGIFSKINVVAIGDAQATKGGITAELEKIKTSANAQDVFIFYYAGHGVMNNKKDFYLVPHDVTQLYGQDEALAQKGFSTNELQQFSKDIKAQKQLFVLDACQSAAAIDQIVAARGAAEEKAIAQLARATGTHWLTASGSEQFASEFAQLGHGAFTYVLLEALSGKADTGDKRISVKELDAYLQTNVPEVTAKYKGTPQYPASYGFGNDFPIITLK